MGANWPHTEGGDWRAELAEWVDPSGCDAWILTGQTLDAASYAAGWIQQQTQDPEQARQDHIDWCDFLERQRITAVGSGYIILRRTDASPWFEIRKLPSVSGEAGAAVDRALRTRRFLHRQSGDEPLLHARLLAAPELERRDIADLVDGRWHTRTVELRLSHGLQFSARINALTGKLIERLDGSTSLIQAAAALMPPSELNADLQSGLAATARRLLELGLLEPVVGRPCPSS